MDSFEKPQPEKISSRFNIIFYFNLGNEYWDGHLSASGDPAAACCTQIAELQNGHINSQFMNANNLHIASPEHGVLHIQEYCRRLLSE